METTLPQQNPSFVRRTFAAIAARYDLANHLLSGGFDFCGAPRRPHHRQRETAAYPRSCHQRRSCLALRKASPRSLVVAADFCLPMLEIARKRVPALVQADGLQLPFQDGKFDALTVAFGLRNMAAWMRALQEMGRATSRGVLLVMDFSLPEFPPLRTVYRVYLHKVLPRFAAVITGNREAYEYLGKLDRVLSARAQDGRANAIERLYGVPGKISLLRSRKYLHGSKSLNKHPAHSTVRPTYALGKCGGVGVGFSETKLRAPVQRAFSRQEIFDLESFVRAQTEIFQGDMNESRLRLIRIHGDGAQYEIIPRDGRLAVKENVVVLGMVKPKISVFVEGAIFVSDRI